MVGLQARLSDSLRFQLSLWLSVSVMLLALSAGGYSFWSSFGEANELQDEQLRQVAALIAQHGLSFDSRGLLPDDRTVDPDLRVVVQLLDTAHATTLNPEGLDIPNTLPDGLQTVRVGREDWRLMVRPAQSGRRVAVGQQTAARDEIALHGALRTVLPLLVLVPCLVLVACLVVRRQLRPVAQLAAEVDRRSEHDLTPLSQAELPSEIRPFAVSIARLLARLQQSIEMQRRFVADAAHELRSPLTAVSLQADALAASGLPSVSKDTLARLQKGLLRSRALVDQLLTFARSQTRPSSIDSVIFVPSVLRAVIEDLLPFAEARHVDLGVVRQDAVYIDGVDSDLYAVLRNLVDNAIRYDPGGGRVDVSLERADQRMLLKIVSEGAGIAEAERERVFDPFYRVLGTEADGSGLGLAIVKTLVERLGGSVALDDATANAVAPGLRACIWLPVAPSMR